MKNKTVGITSRTYGGMLRPFGAVISILANVASGDQDNPDFSALGDNGRFLLDAISRSIWIEATSATTYGSFINTRIRADKRMVIPENKAGYRFFSKDYLMAFGQQVIFNNSMFSSVESVIMRMGAIFQASPVSCSTPNMIDANHAMCEQIYKFVTENPRVKFGAPYVLNSCMVLPPMQFTAPPNCNIVFPCMYDTVTWQHDYDSDLTRAYFRVAQIFGGDSQLSYETKEVPNSLLAYNKANTDAPPLTIEERFKGSNIMEGTVEASVAMNSINDSFANDCLANPSAYVAKVKASGNKQAAAVEKMLNDFQGAKVDSDDYRAKVDRFVSLVKSSGISEVNTPNVSQILNRHATMKFLMNRFSARIITVSGQLNPYIICGFPAAIMADDNRNTYKTTRTIIGQVISIRHQIHTSGTASTQMTLNCCRFISEPTDIDEFGNPLFIGDTDKINAQIDPKSFFYLNKKPETYSPLQRGYPLNKPKDVSGSSKIYDWEPRSIKSDPIDSKGRDLKWAKDILTISKEGREQGKDNLNFTDFKYTPTQIGIFYEEVLGQDKLKHFMVGRTVIDGKNALFMFDSINEAIYNLEKYNKMNDYIAAINFVKREVVSEDDYFIKILGASIRTRSPETNEIIFTNQYEDWMLKNRLDGGWYGIPNNNQLSEIEIDPEYYNVIKPGEFGSIYEKSPVTPFLRERRNSAARYIQEVNQRVNSTR